VEDSPVGTFLLGMLVFFVWFALIWMFVAVFADILRRKMSGWAKAGWILLLVVLPFVGSLIYIIARPKGVDAPEMPSRDGSMRYLHDHQGADAMSRGVQLYGDGKLTAPEYDQYRRQAPR
jgi:predicted membrane channel-forming protein YqfA (hemolysin III family)